MTSANAIPMPRLTLGAANARPRARAGGEPDRHCINQTIFAQSFFSCVQKFEQISEQRLKIIGEKILAAVKRLIIRQIGKLLEPVLADKSVNLPMIEPLIQLSEQINGDDFLVGKTRLEIRAALKFQRTMTIVDVADQQIYVNELIFHKQKNLIILSCLLFLLLIHI